MSSQHDRSLERDIAAALEQIDVTSLDLWSDLDTLSTHTFVEGVEVPAEGIIVEKDGKFSAVMNLYLLLQFGKNNEEGFTQAESLVANIDGHLADRTPIIDHSSVDTSEYYQ